MWTFDASNGQDVDNLNIYLQETDSSETAQAKAPQVKAPTAPALVTQTKASSAPTTEAKTKN